MDDQGRLGQKRVRLTGTRFDGGRLPVDSLIELQKYQKIVRLAAIAEWKHENPDEEVPQDLPNSISLAIEKIDEGSADVYLAFEQHDTYVQYQEEAQEAADAVLVAAYSGGEITDFPALTPDEAFEFRSIVSQFGTTLGPGQTIQYYTDEPDTEPIVISSQTREHAANILLSGEDFLVNPEPETPLTGLKKSDDSLVGKITEVDKDDQSFRFALLDGQQIKGHYKRNPGILPDLIEVFNDSAEGPLTRVTGLLQTKPDGQLYRFWETEKVERVQFDRTDWGQRLTIFAGLRADWDGAGAEQISSVALDAAQTVLRAITEAGIERPGVFPTAEGGVLLEWGSAESVESVELLEDGSYETYQLEEGERQGSHTSGTNLDLAIKFLKAVRA